MHVPHPVTASHGPDSAPACMRPRTKRAAAPAAVPPAAPSIPDLCHSSSQTTPLAALSGEDGDHKYQSGRLWQQKQWFNYSPFNLTALVTTETPQGPSWEHTDASGLLIPGAVPWSGV